ncbi:hypothetical protein BH11MYX2_BH11MYX2_28260 [soil metagenome]
MKWLAVIAIATASSATAFADDPPVDDPPPDDPPPDDPPLDAPRPDAPLPDAPPTTEPPHRPVFDMDDSFTSYTDAKGRHCLAPSRSRTPTVCPEPPPDERNGMLPFLASVVPGVLVHGSGSFVAKDRTTAKKLLGMEGIGLGVAAVGAIPIALSGANPWASGLGQPFVIAGGGLFMQSWFADMYRSSVRAHEVRSIPVSAPLAHPPWALEVGASETHDAYRDRLLWHVGAQAVVAPLLELVANGRRSYDGAYIDGDLQVRTRLYAPRFPYGYGSDRVIVDGSFLELRTTGRVHDDRADKVQVATGELEIAGRLDLRRIDLNLDGSYAELSTGIGVERVAYTTANDYSSLMLARFAWGFYLPGQGELNLYYDHRRDSLAGGIAAWRGASFVGSVGARLDFVRFKGPLSLHVEVEYGNALVSTFGIG